MSAAAGQPFATAGRPHRPSIVSDVGAWVRLLAAVLARSCLASLLTLAVIASAPAALGFICTTVMSDSMSPGLRAGDVVIVRPVHVDEVRLGQVLLVEDPDRPGRLRLHRLYSEPHGDLLLKGDANAQPDSAAVTPGALLGAGFLRVPFIGLPTLWLRQGRTLPVVAAAAAVLGLIAVAVTADRNDDGGEPPRPSKLLRAVRRRRRPIGAIVSVLALGAALPAAPAATAPASAWSLFTASTRSASNTLSTSTWSCPDRSGMPSAYLYYGYMAQSGTGETDLSGQGNDGTFTGGVTRRPGDCSGTSPYVSLSGGSAVVSMSGKQAAPSDYSISLWFNASSSTGVLADWGNVPGSSGASSSDDRMLYFKSDGTLAFGQLFGGAASVCSAPAPTANTWHHAAAVYSSAANTMTLYLDSSTPACTVSVSGSAATSKGYWRFGWDALSGSTWPNASSTGAFTGALDETAVYASALTSSQVASIRSAGH